MLVGQPSWNHEMLRSWIIAGACLVAGCSSLRARIGGHGDSALLEACANLDAAVPPRRPILFGDVQPDPMKEGEWREFRQEQEPELKRGVEAGEIFSTAEVWKYSDGSLRILMALSSASGDWIHYLDYCFRPDGTVARSVSTLNNFNAYNDEHDDIGPISRKNDRVFDRCGKELRVRSAPLMDLKIKQEAPPRTQIMDPEEPQVAHIRDVSFWSVLKETLPNKAVQLPAGCAGRS